jgi:hypothetical protein
MPHSQNPERLAWTLRVGESLTVLGDRPLSIGRLPECDLSLPGEDMSRLHAYVLPTPAGPMLVDRSQLGTRVNGERMRAPWLLADGDTLQMGRHIVRVSRVGVPRLSGRSAAGTVSRVRRWVRRYGPSEVLGTVVTVGATTGVQALTGSTVAAAFAGTLSEVVVYYGVMVLRETIREAYEAGKRAAPYGSAQVLGVIRTVALEFGIAEALDSGVIRPFCLGMGLRLVGGQVGALLGKLAADLVFYGPVLATYEWRLARTRGGRQDVEARHRRTTTEVVPRE